MPETKTALKINPFERVEADAAPTMLTVIGING
jgi:hypothetical protein